MTVVRRCPLAAEYDDELVTRQVISLLAEHHGEEEAARIVERFVAWACCSASKFYPSESKRINALLGRSAPNMRAEQQDSASSSRC